MISIDAQELLLIKHQAGVHKAYVKNGMLFVETKKLKPCPAWKILNVDPGARRYMICIQHMDYYDIRIMFAYNVYHAIRRIFYSWYNCVKASPTPYSERIFTHDIIKPDYGHTCFGEAKKAIQVALSTRQFALAVSMIIQFIEGAE